MASENENEISLESLLAAVGATSDAGADESRHKKARKKADSPEDELFRALGISVPEPEPEPTAEAESNPEPEAASEPELESEAEVDYNPEPVIEPEMEEEPIRELETESAPEPEPEPETEPESEPKVEVDLETEPEPKPELEPELEEAEPQTEPEIEPESEPEPEPEPEPESESAKPADLTPVRVPIPQPMHDDVLPNPPHDDPRVTSVDSDSNAPRVVPASPESQPQRVVPVNPQNQDSHADQKEPKGLRAVSIVLAVLAAICVIAAACLFMGINPLASGGPESNHEASASKSAGAQMTGEPVSMVYSYVVTDAGNEPCEVIETASFGEDGLLESSKLEIAVTSKAAAEEMLAVLGSEFGENMTESTAADDKATCVIVLPENGYDPDSYTELLEKKMTNFKVVSD